MYNVFLTSFLFSVQHTLKPIAVYLKIINGQLIVLIIIQNRYLISRNTLIGTF
jgi:hypothetical protein